MKKILICIISCFLLSGCYSKKDIKYQKPSDQIVKEESNQSHILLLNLHNDKRKSKGLEDLKIDKNLCNYAQKHAEKMANKNSLYHSRMSDLLKESKGSFVGENIAYGQKTEQEVLNSWMKSPTHKWNILRKSYSRVGFGIAKNKDGSIYWCVVFANKEV